MALQRFANCPWCKARIEIERQKKEFACPVCSCIFKFKWTTCFIFIPIAVILSILFFSITGGLALYFGMIFIWLIVKQVGLFAVIKKGEKNISREDAKLYFPARKESRWFISLVVIIDVTVIIIFVLLILHALAVI